MIIKTHACLIGCLVLSLPNQADKPSAKPLNVGQTIPNFTAQDDRCRLWKSSDHVGKNVIVLFFYPADMTRPCVQQVKDFQTRLADLQKRGVQVVGISGDSPENHQLFKKVHSVKFPLLSDVDGKVAKSFGVPLRKGGTITRVIDGQQKTLTRKVTPQNWVFVIGKNGSIIYRDTKMHAPEACVRVMQAVDRLTAATD